MHHTQFRTNYSLFMPVYDYIYGTVDKVTDPLYETSLNKEEEVSHVVQLSHLTTADSIYHLRFGLASLASRPHTSKWYFSLIWPMTLLFTMLNWIYGRTFVVERNRFNNLNLQTWVIPKYTQEVRKIFTTGSFVVLLDFNFFPNFDQHFGHKLLTAFSFISINYI